MNTYTLKSRTYSVVCEPGESPDRIATTPAAAARVFRALMAGLDQDQEHVVMVCLTPKGRVVGHKVISSGTATCCLVTPEQVYRAALVLGGTSVLVAHNHPSGSTEPSQEDQTLTKLLKQAGDFLGLPLADHLILGSPDTYYSFRACAPEIWS